MKRNAPCEQLGENIPDERVSNDIPEWRISLMHLRKRTKVSVWRKGDKGDESEKAGRGQSMQALVGHDNNFGF